MAGLTYTGTAQFSHSETPVSEETELWRLLIRILYLKKNLSTLHLLFYSEDRGRKILRNTDIYLINFTLCIPEMKQATFPAFYGSWKFITTFTRVHHLSLPQPNHSIPLPITHLKGSACLRPDRAKDLSAPRQLNDITVTDVTSMCVIVLNANKTSGFKQKAYLNNNI